MTKRKTPLRKQVSVRKSRSAAVLPVKLSWVRRHAAWAAIGVALFALIPAGYWWTNSQAAVNQGSYTNQLDLSAYKYSTTPYRNDAKPEGVIKLLNNPQRVRTYIFGQSPHNSRNGATYAYDIQGQDEIYLAYDIQYDSNFVMEGGGKQGVNVAAVANGKYGSSGGGKFDQAMSNERLIFEEEPNGKIGVKTYVYTWFFGNSKSSGAYMTIDDAKIFGGCADSEIRFGNGGRCNVRWNDVAIGGNRATSNARYTGVASQLTHNGKPITFSPGEKVTIEVHYKMNTFTNQSIQAYGKTVKVPNHDGVYEVWVNGVLGIRRTGMVFASPLYPDMKFNELQVGAAAGGPFEGMYGGVEISNVRYGGEGGEPVPRPDLEVVPGSVTTVPASPVPGQPVRFSATIRNRGDAPTPSDCASDEPGYTPGTCIHGVLFRINGAIAAWSDDFRDPLAPGETRTVTSNGGPNGGIWTPSATGEYELETFVDNVNRIAESDESNNKEFSNVTVTERSGVKPGDVNGDGSVNAADLNTVLTNYGQTGRTRAQGDLSGDGVVSALDLSAIIRDYSV